MPATAYRIFLLALMFIGQVIAQFMMYRDRALSHGATFNSDLLVFALPWLVGFAADLNVFRHGRSMTVHFAVATAIAATLASLAWMTSMFLALNFYGS